MILVPPIQPTSVRVRSEIDEFADEGAWEPGEPRPAFRVVSEPEPEPEEWFEPGIGWDDPLDGDDDNTVVVAARRPSRVQFENRPTPPRLIEAVAEPADLRWDLRPAVPTERDAEVIDAPTEPPLSPAGDRPWWADPNELVDLSVEPGPRTPLLARAFRGSSPSRAGRSEVRPATASYSSSAELVDADDDITAPPGQRPMLPPRVRRRRRR